MNPNFDMSGVVVFENLVEDTHYTFEIGYFCSEQEFDDLYAYHHLEWGNALTGSFQTASTDPNQEREFIFGSCRYLLKLLNGILFDSRGDKTLTGVENS